MFNYSVASLINSTRTFTAQPEITTADIATEPQVVVPYMLTHPALDINNFINDGFQRVADVHPRSTEDAWFYHNTDESLLFANHRSWVYFVVINQQIVKCGETGNPLGIRTYYGKKQFGVDQPVSGTKSRFGRLARHKEASNSGRSNTDSDIREAAKEYLDAGQIVSLWAKKCPYGISPQIINGIQIDVVTTIHKDLEVRYLNTFEELTGRLPILNRSKK